MALVALVCSGMCLAFALGVMSLPLVAPLIFRDVVVPPESIRRAEKAAMVSLVGAVATVGAVALHAVGGDEGWDAERVGREL